jgi:hypothetical protein
MIFKDVQFMLETAPPEGYNSQSKEGPKLADSKKQMSELVGMPERVSDAHFTAESETCRHNIPSAVLNHTSRHERLVQLHSHLILLSTIASTSSADFESTSGVINTSIQALLCSLDAVPIPSNIGDRETTDIGDADRKSQSNPPTFELHSQSISSRGINFRCIDS